MKQPKVAYFSLEIGVESDIPTYSGGLGVLAGDTLKSAADMGLPVVGISLLYNRGYMRQYIKDATQYEAYDAWIPKTTGLHQKDVSVEFLVQGRKVKAMVWQYNIVGRKGHIVPVYFLDTNIHGNPRPDGRITWALYGGDSDYDRIVQELLLGVGGLRVLRRLGYDKITTYHMNEGHAAFLALERMKEEGGNLEKVIEGNAFTTHTPVPAGHDQFDYNDVRNALAPELWDQLMSIKGQKDIGWDKLNMTKLALETSRTTNAVAKKHAVVSRAMFPGHEILAITNGVHPFTWTSPQFTRLYDDYWQGKGKTWRDDMSLLKETKLLIADVRRAHHSAKETLLDYLNTRYSINGLDKDIFTIGFARRFATYKRANLILYNLKKLKEIAGENRPLQILFAGKAHPRDGGGKDIIREILTKGDLLRGSNVRVEFIENHNMEVGALLTSGVDLWLNNPQRPKEASGTSGMKAALNGVPNLSVLDGWWWEAWEEDDSVGWAIGPKPAAEDTSDGDFRQDNHALYNVLNDLIVPMWYDDNNSFLQVGLNGINRLASYFNTHRMDKEYWEKVWKR